MIKKYSDKCKMIVKQLLMIEDKLFNVKKKCQKCIFEHMMLVESMIEDNLKNNKNELYPILSETSCTLRELQKMMMNKKLDITTSVQKLRSLRKEITKKCVKFDKPVSEKTLKRMINHKCKGKILPILNPLFNLRETYKNVLLLKDHLLVKEHRCNQCHKKHSLLIEAFLEEAATLDMDGKYQKLLLSLEKTIRRIQRMIIKGNPVYGDVVKELEKMEKKLYPYAMKFLELDI